MMGTPRRSESSPLLRNYGGPEEPGVSPVIREDDDAITIRRPVQYYSIHAPNQQEHNVQTRATINRLKYYSRLDPRRDSSMVMPNHVVPPEYFLVLPFRPEVGNQSSLVTIFSIWNTMVGTSILSMPWALEQAGFACGITMMCLMAAITLYTAYRVMKSPQRAGMDCGVTSGLEFSDVVKLYLGSWGEYTTVIFSLITLLGAAIVYWVLMTNFLYHSVTFIYNRVNDDFNTSNNHPLSNLSHHDVYCPNPELKNKEFEGVSAFQASILPDNDLISHANDTVPTSLFHTVWVENKTVPFFLILVLGPIVNFRSPTFFTKFNALGTVSIMYIITIIIYKASQWHVNVDFSDKTSFFYVPQFQWTFPAITGILSLALFIHNCVLSIVRNQKQPENNGRDLSIAYICVAMTYILVGTIFYISFPLTKSCIEDNLLNNFYNADIVAFTARLFLFFQMVTVFPLLLYICRIQVFNTLYNELYPGLPRVMLLNGLVIGLAILFAIFLPQIGTIIRYSGALCGFVYVFTLPCIIHMISLSQEGKLTWPVIIIHTIIIICGLANLVAQFII